MRRWPLAAASVLMLAACAPVVHPPSPALEFLSPPQTVFSGVIARAGANAGSAADNTAPVGGFVQLVYKSELRALLNMGPSCQLGARVVTPPYVDIPGRGFSRQIEGVLALDAGATCALGGGSPMTVATGLATVSGVGLLNFELAGHDAQDLPASLRFSGLLVDQRESAPPLVEPGTVKVHLLAELVTNCPHCRYAHTSIGLAGRFPFRPGLEKQVPTPAGPTWTPICAAPCTAIVERQALLRVAGAGLPDSQPFSLPVGRPRVVLKASSTGSAAHAFGWTFVGAGTLFVALGAALFASGYAEAASDPAKGHRLELGGLSFAASSLGFFVPGLLVLGHEGTTITTDRGETLAPR